MRILAQDTLGIVIDVQDRLLTAMNDKDVFLTNTLKLIKGLRILEIPLIVTQQYTKGIGMTCPEIQTSLGEEFNYFDKISFSCIEDSTIEKEIKNSGKKNIILFGIEAHICVLQTVIDCMASGYQTIVVKDCISSRKKSDEEIAITRYIKEGAIVTTYESILYELMRSANNKNFKEILKLIK